MAHCPYDSLADLETELEAIRSLEMLREPKPGIFYLKSKPFLHFHLKDGMRWADARCGHDWGPALDVPFQLSAKARKAFLAEVKRYYAETIAALTKRP